MRNTLILIILFSSCQQDNLTNRDKLSGIWIYSKQINTTKSSIPDTVTVTEYKFISDTSGLLFIYDFYIKTGTSNKKHTIDMYAPNQDSFHLDKSFSNLTIIPGHLLKPLNYKIEQLTDTLKIRDHKFDTVEIFYKLKN